MKVGDLVRTRSGVVARIEREIGSFRHLEHCTTAYHVSELELLDGRTSRRVVVGAGASSGHAPAGAQGVDANGTPVDVAPAPVVLEPAPATAGVEVVGWKDTNPKSAFGDKKAPLSCVPAPVLGELGLAMLEGALKYGRHNYRVSGVRASTYYDALMRHMTAYWEGEDIDPESGLPHLVKAMACAAVLRDAQMLGLVTDDRPPKAPAGWQEALNEKARALKAKYPDPKPPHTR